jgi:predicted RecA/RadA family phage recombinase
MKNFVENGGTLRYTVSGTAVKSGDVVMVGKVGGVAITDGAVGETITLSTQGVYRLPKSSGAIAQGQAVYVSATDGSLTTTATGNNLLGYAWEDAASGDSAVNVKIFN